MNDAYENLARYDTNDRRSGIDRRQLTFAFYTPERRSGNERRSGVDRRKKKAASNKSAQD